MGEEEGVKKKESDPQRQSAQATYEAVNFVFDTLPPLTERRVAMKSLSAVLVRLGTIASALQIRIELAQEKKSLLLLLFFGVDVVVGKQELRA